MKRIEQHTSARPSSRTIIGLVLAVVVLLGIGMVRGQSAQVDAVPEAPAEPTLQDLTQVSVDWFEELRQGGSVIVFQLLGSVVMIAIGIERWHRLKRARFAPAALIEQAHKAIASGDNPKLKQAIDAHPSTLARMLGVWLEHPSSSIERIENSAADLAGREMTKQEERCTPLAIIAALEPLLGLLGTMIGMIESFKLVEVFGDEGGATILAGSISKALITTALGLILAIPAVILFHYFRYVVIQRTGELEEEADRLFNQLIAAREPAVAATGKGPAVGAAAARQPSPAPDKPLTPAAPVAARPTPVGGGAKA
ncbi:MAG: MotA/TolQ/ExbB proton channel family protein [Phycisphaerae bacterium]